jgi:hypothetical protein
MEMTVYAYARVSTLQQANDGDSLDAQVKQVIGYASSRGLELNDEGVFVEKGVSGGQEFGSRPAWRIQRCELHLKDLKLDKTWKVHNEMPTLQSLCSPRFREYSVSP